MVSVQLRDRLRELKFGRYTEQGQVQFDGSDPDRAEIVPTGRASILEL
jgi:hypothetical protein